MTPDIHIKERNHFEHLTRIKLARERERGVSGERESTHRVLKFLVRGYKSMQIRHNIIEFKNVTRTQKILN